MPQFRSALAALSPIIPCTSLPARAAQVLSDPEDNLTALVTMRCTLDPEEHVLTWWKGNIFVHP